MNVNNSSENWKNCLRDAIDRAFEKLKKTNSIIIINCEHSIEIMEIFLEICFFPDMDRQYSILYSFPIDYLGDENYQGIPFFQREETKNIDGILLIQNKKNAEEYKIAKAIYVQNPINTNKSIIKFNPIDVDQIEVYKTLKDGYLLRQANQVRAPLYRFFIQKKED